MASQLDRSAASAGSLLDALDTLWSIDDPATLGRRIVAESAALLPGLISELALADSAESERATVFAASEDLGSAELPLQGSAAGLALRTGEVVEVPVSQAFDGENLQRQGITTLRALPLAGTGALVFMTRAAGGFTDAERTLTEQFARLAGVALERTRLLAQARQSAASLRKAFEVAMAMAGAVSHHDVIDSLLKRVVEALDAERATLSSVDEGGLVVQASYDRRGAALAWVGARAGLTYLDSQPFVREAIATRAPVIGGRLNVDSDVPAFREALAAIRHTLTLPLIHGEDLEALLVLSRTEDKPFVESDVVTIQLIGSAAMLALRSARLYDDSERARAAAESLARAQQLGIDSALDVANELNLDDLVSRIVRRAAEVSGADRCVLLSVEGERAAVEASYAADGSTGAQPGSSFEITEQPLLVEAFAAGAAVQSSGRRGEAGGMQLFATVPLILRGRPIAALSLSRLADDPFTPDQLAALTQIGQITALAVRNARLFEDLDVASRSKTEFLNLAAHELRTPISVIKGYLSLILDGSLAAMPIPLVQPLTVVQEKATELNVIVEDLLAAARVQAGTIAANPVDIDARAIVERAVGRVRPAINLAGGSVSLRLPNRPAAVLVDQAHLERILDNLLNNAVAYSSGGPEIAVSMSIARGQVRIDVHDRGRGIPGDSHERIFDQFVRVEDSAAGYTPGTGLGLYISRGLARRHGGDVELVRSEPGQGSVFALVLPLSRG